MHARGCHTYSRNAGIHVCSTIVVVVVPIAISTGAHRGPGEGETTCLGGDEHACKYVARPGQTRGQASKAWGKQELKLVRDLVVSLFCKDMHAAVPCSRLFFSSSSPLFLLLGNLFSSVISFIRMDPLVRPIVCMNRARTKTNASCVVNAWRRRRGGGGGGGACHFFSSRRSWQKMEGQTGPFVQYSIVVIIVCGNFVHLAVS